MLTAARNEIFHFEATPVGGRQSRAVSRSTRVQTAELPPKASSVPAEALEQASADGRGTESAGDNSGADDPDPSGDDPDPLGGDFAPQPPKSISLLFRLDFAWTSMRRAKSFRTANFGPAVRRAIVPS